MREEILKDVIPFNTMPDDILGSITLSDDGDILEPDETLIAPPQGGKALPLDPDELDLGAVLPVKHPPVGDVPDEEVKEDKEDDDLDGDEDDAEDLGDEEM